MSRLRPIASSYTLSHPWLLEIGVVHYPAISAGPIFDAVSIRHDDYGVPLRAVMATSAKLSQLDTASQ